MPVAFVVFNARIHTCEASMPVVDALVVDDDHLAFVGSARDALQAFPQARRMDAAGLTVLPGFVDAHLHLERLGLSMREVDLSGVTSARAVADLLLTAGSAAKGDGWITGRGWDHTAWQPNRLPSAQDVDTLPGDRPMWLVRKDLHAGWANSEAMRRAGVERDTPDPPGGRIVRDESGAPTGVFIDAAMSLVERHVPQPTPVEREEAIDAATTYLHSLGITAVHDAGVGAEAIERYQRREMDGRLSLRVNAMIDAKSVGWAEFMRDGVRNGPHGMLAVRMVKFFMDGALGSRGAALLSPYADDPGNLGLLQYEMAEFQHLVAQTVAAGFQPCTHAIGDKAVRCVVDAYERAMTSDQRRQLRPRIEHVQVVEEKEVPRFAALGIVASMQPVHRESDAAWVAERLGAERVSRAYAWRRLKEAGAALAFGSDAPVESPDPIPGLLAATSNAGFMDEPASISMNDAIRAYTIDAAWAGHQERLHGSLVSGKKADFVVLTGDPFEPDEDLAAVDVVATFVGGRLVWGGW